jgi:hypothetical protein
MVSDRCGQMNNTVLLTSTIYLLVPLARSDHISDLGNKSNGVVGVEFNANRMQNEVPYSKWHAMGSVQHVEQMLRP